MKNCLIKTFKGSANNENLEPFGKLTLYASSAIYGKIFGNEVHESILELTEHIVPYSTISGDIIDSTHSYVPTAGNAKLYQKNGAAPMVFTVSNKYNINHIENFACDIKDLIYVPAYGLLLKALNTETKIIKYKIEDFSQIYDKTKLTYLKIEGYSSNKGYVTGSISDLLVFPNLNTIRIIDSNCIGSINTLSSLPLSYIEFTSSTSIEGSVDVLAAALAPNKENGNTLKVTGNSVITYKPNADHTGDDTIIPNGTTKTVTFDGHGGYSIA